MQRVLSTHIFVNHRLSTVWLDRIWDSGISAVEIFCARQHLDYHNRAQIDELGHWFRDSQLTLHSLHSPIYSDEVWGKSGPHSVLDITSTLKARRIAVVDEIKRALEVAETIPCRYLIQHLGVNGQDFDERRAEAGFTSIEEISTFARHRGVEILIENIRNEFSSAERLLWFNQLTHLNLNFCFDIGHANLMEGVEETFQPLRSRIRSTHIHDNDGQDDLHMFPMAEGGTIDWPRAMTMLRTLNQTGVPLLLELKELPGVRNPFAEVRRVFETLESLTERAE